MFNNDKRKLYKVGLSDNINILEEDCFDKCDQSNCVKMLNQKKILNDCLKCNIQKKKCFNKSIIGGNCDDCMKGETPIDCLRTDNFGCTNPANFNSFNGSYPYYFELPDYNITSPLDQKCVFCWQIEDQI